MAEKKDDGYKKPIIVAVVFALVLVAGIFFLQQRQNSAGIVGNTVDNSAGTSSGSQATAGTSDAGSIGKNEMKLDDSNFQSNVLDAKGVVLVDFYLSTCPHCQKVAADVTAVSDSLVGKAKVGKIESSGNSKMSDKYKVESVPTFILFKNGKEVARAVGERSKDELISLVEKQL